MKIFQALSISLSFPANSAFVPPWSQTGWENTLGAPTSMNRPKHYSSLNDLNSKTEGRNGVPDIGKPEKRPGDNKPVRSNLPEIGEPERHPGDIREPKPFPERTPPPGGTPPVPNPESDPARKVGTPVDPTPGKSPGPDL